MAISFFFSNYHSSAQYNAFVTYANFLNRDRQQDCFFMIQSIILMTFLPRGRDRGREGEFSVFLLPALSTLGSTIQSKLNEVIRSVWGSFPRAEPFGIFCSFLNGEMLSNIARFLQTALCNAHLICICNTALQQVMIIQTKPGDISMCLLFSFFLLFFRTQRASFSCKYSCSVLLPAIHGIFLRDEKIVYCSSVKYFFTVQMSRLWQQATVLSTQQCAQSCVWTVYDKEVHM